MAGLRPLTELEGTVLGIVWARQPCTAYQVRREFTDSPSPHWSGSAGAIYPLVVRLETAGLVRSVAHATGSRKSRLYRVTPRGRGVLQRWVGPRVPEEVVGVPPDPLRARVALLHVLPPGLRLTFLQELESRLAGFLALAEADLASGRAGDPEFELMARGAIAMQRTRLEWLRGILMGVRRHGPEWPRRVGHRVGHRVGRRVGRRVVAGIGSGGEPE